jgi:GT2 family glycosyltransferase
MSKTDKPPLVSVVIIGKNEQRNIEKCILSIINQTYPNFEVVYVDDNSSDNTVRIAQELRSSVKNENCKKFEVIPVKSGIPGKNRNVGIKFSKGYVVAFIDADCIAESDWITNLLTAFSLKTGLVGGPIRMMHSKVSITTKAIDLVMSSYIGSGGSALFYKIKEDREVDEIPAGNMAVRKSLLMRLGGFNERLRYNEDTFLCYNARKLGFRVIYACKAKIYHFIGVDTYAGFLHYFNRYGFERGKNTAISLNFLTKFNKISLAVMLLGISLVILSIFTSAAATTFLYLIVILILIELVFSLKLVIPNRCAKLFFLVFLILLSLHTVYNIGFISGLLISKFRRSNDLC